MSRYIFFALICSFISACKTDNPTETNPPRLVAIFLDYQKGFQSDSIQMNLDGKERAWIFSDGSGLNGYAGGWSTNLIEGQHNIKVIVLKDSVSADTTFLHKTKPLYIGVNYFRSERKLTFTFSDSAFKYPFGSVLANHSLKLTENTARDFAARK